METKTKINPASISISSAEKWFLNSCCRMMSQRSPDGSCLNFVQVFCSDRSGCNYYLYVCWLSQSSLVFASRLQFLLPAFSFWLLAVYSKVPKICPSFLHTTFRQKGGVCSNFQFVSCIRPLHLFLVVLSTVRTNSTITMTATAFRKNGSFAERVLREITLRLY